MRLFKLFISILLIPLRKLNEFFEAPNGRFDLKQLAGAYAVYTLCEAANRKNQPSDALVWALLVLAIFWFVGDAAQAINAVMAAAGGFKQVPQNVTQEVKPEGDINLNAPSNAEQS